MQNTYNYQLFIEQLALNRVTIYYKSYEFSALNLLNLIVCMLYNIYFYMYHVYNVYAYT